MTRAFGSLLSSLLVLLATPVLAEPQRQSPQIEHFALVIGTNRSEGPGLASLRYADDDAVQTHELLNEAGFASTLLTTMDSDTREMHPDLSAASPTAAELERQLSQLGAAMASAARRGAITELVFFYSGHGDVDVNGEGFLLLEDARLTRTQLYELLKRLGAGTNHVIVDACASSTIAPRSAGGRRRPYTGVRPTEALSSSIDNTGFVLSTSTVRSSHEWERYQGGVFSHELRSGLRGGADADLNGEVSYEELYAFLQRANSSLVPRYRPDVLVRAPRHDATRVLLHWNAPASVQLSPQDWGHIYVETAQGERIMDLHPSDGRSAQLWLPKVRPLFVRTNDESAEYVLVEDPPSLLERSSARAASIARKGALHIALESLFAAPFSIADVPYYAAGIDASPPTETPFEEAALRDEPGTRAVTWWVAGGAAITLGAGLAAGIGSKLEYNRVDELKLSCPSCTRERIASEQTTGRTLQTTANVLFIVGGVAAAASVVLFVFEPGWTARTVEVSVGPGSLQLRGQF